MSIAHEAQEVPTLGLANVAEGAAEELFQEALRDVLKNMQDPNTDAEKARVITLKFTFVQNEERKMAALHLDCSVKLRAVKPVPAVVYIGREKGVLAAVEAPRQRDMFQTPAGKPQAVEAVDGS